MQPANASRFSLESVDHPPPPLRQLCKFFRFGKTGTSEDKGTRVSSTSTTPVSPLPIRNSPRRQRRDMSRHLPPHIRELNHSVSAPSIRSATPQRHYASSSTTQIPDSNQPSSHEPPFSEGALESRAPPVRRRTSMDLTGIISFKTKINSKWTWKGKVAFASKPGSPLRPTDHNSNDLATSEKFDTSAPSATPPMKPLEHTLPPIISDVCEVDVAALLDSRSISTTDDYCSTPTSATGSTFSELQQCTRHTSQRSHGSISKVSRTLGYPEITFATEFGEVPLSAGYSYSPFDKCDSPPKSTPVKLSRRVSLTLSNLAVVPGFLRPSTNVRPIAVTPNSHSRASQSADDVHHFGLEDDLSETWGRVSESCHSVEVSPITFRPSTNSAFPPPSKHSLSGGVSPSFSTLTSGRSPSYALPRLAGTASRPQTPSEDETNLSDTASVSRSTTTRRLDRELHGNLELIEPSAKPVSSRNWSGEWNQDDMQHVIKKLRCLK